MAQVVSPVIVTPLWELAGLQNLSLEVTEETGPPNMTFKDLARPSALLCTQNEV